MRTSFPKHRPVRRLIAAVSLVLAFGVLLSASSCAQSTTILITQIYGGGGGTTSADTYNQDFVELLNISSAPIALDNYAIQYGSTTGTTISTLSTFPAGTTILAGHYLLVAGPMGTNSPNLSPTPDVTISNIGIAAAGGRVYLTNSQTKLATSCAPTDPSVVDFVGIGASTCFEGTGPSPATSATSSVVRIALCTDTNDNSKDFTTLTPPTAHNSASAAPSCAGGTAPATAPSVSGVTVNPSTVTAGSTTLLTATVTKGTNSIATVTADTSSLGGTTTQTLYDDGTNGDVTASDGIYTYKLSVPGAQAASTYTLTVKATDTASLSGTGSATLTVNAAIVSTPISLTAAAATPSTVTSGANTILSVKVNPGTLPTSTGVAVTANLSAFGGSSAQTLYDDGTHGDVTAGDNSFAYTLTVPSSQSATGYTITFNASDSQLRTANTTTTLTVQAPIAAAATATVSASTSSALLGSPVTFTALVTGNKGSTPTGTVTFYDGTTLLGQGIASATAGTYTYTTSSLVLGAHSVTAVYSGDSVYPGYTVPSSAAAAVTITPIPVADFSVSIANFNLIATAHTKVQTTMVNVMMVNGFSSAVSFACSGLPAGTRCIFSPATLIQSGSSVLTIAVDDAALHPRSTPFGKHGEELSFAFAFLILPVGLLRRRKTLSRSLLGLLLLGALAVGVSGCGADNTTPTGTSTITVTATGGRLTKTATLTLTVQ